MAGLFSSEKLKVKSDSSAVILRPAVAGRKDLRLLRLKDVKSSLNKSKIKFQSKNHIEAD
jgi:hypothetical protein